MIKNKVIVYTSAIELIQKEIDKMWGTPSDMLDVAGREERLVNIRKLEDSLSFLIREKLREMKKIIDSQKDKE